MGFIDCTLWEWSAERHILHISRVYTRQVQKGCAFNIKCSGWMNTFRQTQFIACCIYVLGLVWGFMLKATAGMWMEQQTSDLWGICSEYWASWLLTMFLHSLAYFFSVGLKYHIFCYQILSTKFFCVEVPNFLCNGHSKVCMACSRKKVWKAHSVSEIRTVSKCYLCSTDKRNLYAAKDSLSAYAVSVESTA